MDNHTANLIAHNGTSMEKKTNDPSPEIGIVVKEDNMLLLCTIGTRKNAITEMKRS